MLLLLLSLWRFWLFYFKNWLFQPWISRVIHVWGWLFLGQVILLIHMAMLAGHLRKPHRNFDTIVLFESITQESSVLVWNSRLNINDTYTTKVLYLGRYLEHRPWSQKKHSIIGNLRTTRKFTTKTSVDWEKTRTRTSVSARKRKLKMQSVGRSTTTTLNVK